MFQKPERHGMLAKGKQHLNLQCRCCKCSDQGVKCSSYVPVSLHDSLNSTDGALPPAVPSLATGKEKCPDTKQAVWTALEPAGLRTILFS